MANQYGIDLGKVYNDIETIKGNRLINSGREREIDQYEAKRNKDAKVRKLSIKFMANDSGSDNALKQLQLDAPEVAINLTERRDARVKKAQIKKNKEMMASSHAAANGGGNTSNQRDYSKPSPYRDRGLAGEDDLTAEEHTKKYNDALTNLYNLDAPAAKLYEERFNDLDDADKERIKAANNKVGNYAFAVLRAPKEEQQAEYDRMRLEMGQEVGDDSVMPLEVSLPWLEYTGANAYSQLEVIKFSKKPNPVLVRTGHDKGEDEYTLYTGGVAGSKHTRPSKKGDTTNVNIDNSDGSVAPTDESSAYFKQWDKDTAATDAKVYAEVQEEARLAHTSNNQMRQLRAIDADTGLFVPTLTALSKALTFFGLEGEAWTGINVAKTEEHVAIIGKITKTALDAATGVQTDGDAERQRKTEASIENVAESVNYLITQTIGINERKIEKAKFLRSFYKAKKAGDNKAFADYATGGATIDDYTTGEADVAWSDYMDATPMQSDVLKSPTTGLPLFYYEYKKTMMALNKYSEAQIIAKWRQYPRNP